MQDDKEKVENGKKILQQIKDIKSGFESELVDHVEEEMSFLDKVNKLIRLILGDDTLSIYQALDKESLGRWKKARFSRWLKKVVVGNLRYSMYFILLSTITCFLVSEALAFYAVNDLIDTKVYVKAILTEVCFIFLSGYRPKAVMEKIWVNVLRAGMFSLMMFVITSQTLKIGTRDSAEIDIIQQQIVLVQDHIKQKEKDIEYFKRINWPRNAARTTIEKQGLLEKLIDLKEQQAKGKNQDVSKIEVYKMYGKAMFRVLLLFISVLITRRIFSF